MHSLDKFAETTALLDPTSKRAWRLLLDVSHKIAMVIVAQLAPLLLSYIIKARVHRAASVVEDADGIPPEYQSLLAIKLEDLRSAHRLELDRRKKLESKAQSNLTAAALASGFGLGALTLMARNDYFKSLATLVPFIIFVGFAVVQLSSAAISAVHATGVERMYDMFIEEYLSTSTYGQADDETNQKAQFIKMTKLNEAYTLIVANFAHASELGMRNGIISLCAALAWATLVKVI